MGGNRDYHGKTKSLSLSLSLHPNAGACARLQHPSHHPTHPPYATAWIVTRRPRPLTFPESLPWPLARLCHSQPRICPVYVPRPPAMAWVPAGGNMAKHTASRLSVNRMPISLYNDRRVRPSPSR